MASVGTLLAASNNTVQPVSSVASVKEVSNFTIENAIPQPKNEKEVGIQLQGNKLGSQKLVKSSDDNIPEKDEKRVKSQVNKPSLSLSALINIQESLFDSEEPRLSPEQVIKKYSNYQISEQI